MKTTSKQSKPAPSKRKKTALNFRKNAVSIPTVKSSIIESVLQLQNLRLQVKEIALNQSNKLQSDISQLIEDIQVVKRNTKGIKSQEIMQILNKIILIIQNLKLKPEKGRFKDLRRIHDITKIIRRLRNSLDQ